MDKPKLRVLVIEDEESIRHFMQRVLEASYEFHEAADGAEGIKQARKVKPQVILLDLRLPDTDGLSVLAKLKTHPETASIPVVIVSARGETGVVVEGQQSGAADYLIKPFTIEQLREAVGRNIVLEDPLHTSRQENLPPLVSGRSKTRPKILLIDDEEGIRNFMSRVLIAQCEVHEAADGEEGVTRAKIIHPDLIFLDLHLPGMDGLSVLSRLKADPKTQTIPIVIVSVRGESETLLEGQSAGAADYLIKPFPIEDLQRIAARYLPAM